MIGVRITVLLLLRLIMPLCSLVRHQTKKSPFLIGVEPEKYIKEGRESLYRY